MAAGMFSCPSTKAQVDELLGIRLFLDHALAAIPVHHLVDAADVEPAVRVRQRLRDRFRRHGGPARDQRQQLFGLGGILVGAVGVLVEQHGGIFGGAALVGVDDGLQRRALLGDHARVRGEPRRLPRDLVAGPADDVRLPLIDEAHERRARARRDVDLIPHQHRSQVAEALRRHEVILVDVEAVLLADAGDGVVIRRADRREPDDAAAHVGHRAHTGVPRFVRRENARVRKTRQLAAVPRDDDHAAEVREVEERRREADDGEVDVARGDRERGRNGGVEEHELRLNAGVGEVALLDAHEERRLRRDPQHADLHRRELRAAAASGSVDRTAATRSPATSPHECSNHDLAAHAPLRRARDQNTRKLSGMRQLSPGRGYCEGLRLERRNASRRRRARRSKFKVRRARYSTYRCDLLSARLSKSSRRMSTAGSARVRQLDAEHRGERRRDLPHVDRCLGCAPRRAVPLMKNDACISGRSGR